MFTQTAPAASSAPTTKRRFAVLDGLRGVAAMVVVILHSFNGTDSVVPNGVLAVDLFFVLSGFVIAYSYDDRLARSNSWKQFLLSRFFRLYPMLFIGAVTGIIFAFVHNVTNASHAYPVQSIAASGALSLLVLPYLNQDALGEFVFSFNPPIWSLFFEIVANVAYVLFFRFWNVRVLTCLSIVALIGVVAIGALGGDSKDNFVAGFPRVMTGFFSGVLLFKLWRSGRLPGVRSNIFISSAMILIVFMFPTKIGGWLYIPAFALLIGAVIGGINSRASGMDGVCELLGLVSYPIYMIHVATLYIVTFIGNKLALGPHPYMLLMLGYLVAIPFIGYLFAVYYETPARSLLKRMFAPAR